MANASGTPNVRNLETFRRLPKCRAATAVGQLELREQFRGETVPFFGGSLARGAAVTDRCVRPIDETPAARGGRISSRQPRRWCHEFGADGVAHVFGDDAIDFCERCGIE